MKINEELYNKWLNEKYAVATRTQEEYDQFMQWLEDNTDYKWSDGDNIFEFSACEKNKKETCIAMNYTMTSGLTYGNEINNKKNGYQIIEFKDLFTQDLRELIEVWYRVISRNVLGDDVDVVTKSFHQEIYLRDLDTNLVSKEDSRLYITKIYHPKYNGIKSIGKPEWELVWERKEELYTLQTPITGHYLCKTQNGINLRHKNDKYNGVRHNEDRGENAITFTKKEIDNLPNQDFIKTLDKKLYEETK